MEAGCCVCCFVGCNVWCCFSATCNFQAAGTAVPVQAGQADCACVGCLRAWWIDVLVACCLGWLLFLPVGSLVGLVDGLMDLFVC